MKNVLNLNSHNYNYNKATRWLVRDSYYFKYNFQLFKKIIVNKKQETLNTTVSSLSGELNKLNTIRDDFGRIINNKEKVKYIIYGDKAEKKKTNKNIINEDIMMADKPIESEKEISEPDFSNKLYEMSYASKYLNPNKVILTDFKPNCSFHIHDKELTLKSLLIRLNCMRKKDKYFEKDLLKHLFKNENNFFEIIKNAQMDVSSERAKFDFNVNEYLEKIKSFSSIDGEMSEEAKLDIDMMIFEEMKFEKHSEVKIEPNDMFHVVADRVYSKSLIVNNYIVNKMYPFLKTQNIFIERKKVFNISLKSNEPKANINHREIKKQLLKRIVDNDDLRYTKTNPINETVSLQDFKNLNFYDDIALESIENSSKGINLFSKINKAKIKKDILNTLLIDIKSEVLKNQEEIHINHLQDYKSGNNKRDPVVFNVVSSRLFALEKEIIVRLINKIFEIDVAVRFNIGYNNNIVTHLFSNFDLLRRSSKLSDNIHDRCHFGIVYINGFVIFTSFTRPYYGLVEHNPLCVDASRVYNLNLDQESNFYNTEDVIEFARLLHILNYSEPREIEELKYIQKHL